MPIKETIRLRQSKEHRTIAVYQRHTPLRLPVGCDATYRFQVRYQNMSPRSKTRWAGVRLLACRLSTQTCPPAQ